MFRHFVGGKLAVPGPSMEAIFVFFRHKVLGSIVHPGFPPFSQDQLRGRASMPDECSRVETPVAEFEFFALSAQPTRQRLVHNETRLELLHGGILAVPIKGQSLVHVRRTLVGKGQQSIRIHVQKDFRLWKGGHDQGGRRRPHTGCSSFPSWIQELATLKKAKHVLPWRAGAFRIRCDVPFHPLLIIRMPSSSTVAPNGSRESPV